MVVAWKWYYHAGSAPLWLLIVLLVAALAENRQRQAWLIFVPLAVVALVGKMLPRVTGAPTETAEWFSIATVSAAIAWAAVWLLGRRLAARRGIGRFIAAIVVLLAVGGLSSLLCVGPDNAEDLRGLFVAHGVASVVLLLGMMRAGRSCRDEFHRGRFMRRLFSSMVLAALIPVLLVLTLSVLVGGIEATRILIAVIQLATMSLVAAGTLYLLNLPFLLLAFNSAFYNARFHALFCPQRSPTMTAETIIPTPADPATPSSATT